jgi:hypothetical protein
MRIASRALGVYVPGLNEFVRASWTIPENPFLGPGMAGLRAFVPARFTLPPQPAGIGDFVGARFTLPPQPAGIGDFVGTAAMYPIPPNSVTAGAAGLVQNGGLILNPGTLSASFGTTDPGAGVPGLGCAGGPGHECSDCKSGHGCHGGMGGLGQAMTDFGTTVSNLTSGNMSGAWTSFMSFLEDPAFGAVPIWMVGGGLLLTWALFFSGGSHSRYSRGRKASAAARRAYA